MGVTKQIVSIYFIVLLLSKGLPVIHWQSILMERKGKEREKTMCDYNAVMKQLAEYKRIQEETNGIIEGLQDELKTYMKDNKLDVLNGNEHKATYKPITSSRIDTTALKNELPDIATKYTRETTTHRFTFS